ncbi:MAG: hypothetical protein K8W52_34815 [Deltaproteobacteria bacterium]|nr:hypothetical protein [Deltaproteobacteria bacterium]
MIAAGTSAAQAKAPDAKARSKPAATPAADERVPRCRSTFDRIDGDREESWDQHFELLERTADGALYKLGDDSAPIDVHSDIVIRRISTDPQSIYVVDSEREYEDERGERDDKTPAPLLARIAALRKDENELEATDDPNKPPECALRMNDGFDVDVTIFRPTDNTCPIFAAVGALQYSDVFSRYGVDVPAGCRATMAALTSQRELKHGDDVVISSRLLHHGDRLQIDLYGDRIRDVETEFGCDTDSQTRIRTCKVKYNTVWGQLVSRSLLVVDFARISPMEIERGHRASIIGTTDRVDIEDDVAVDLPDTDPLLGHLRFSTNATSGGDIVVDAQGLAGTTARPIDIVMNGGHLTLRGLKAEEVVSLTIKKRVRKDKTDEYVEVARYQFVSVARGLHYAGNGDRAARYGTSSALVIRRPGADREWGFAQTFSYTFFYRTRYPSIWDHLGLGVHASLLVVQKAADASSSDQLGLGLGGQLTLGQNVVHIGAGYDFKAQHAYILVGIDLPDLVTFIQKAK